jgi:ectoine hydroxylase-related dioxygenase (phytanoyl-CoA dioxygenase family)
MMALMDELREKGYCVLPRRLESSAIETCRNAFWPILLDYIDRHEANRGPNRYYLPMPFERPCYDERFFFDEGVLAVVRGAMGTEVVADQWSCDVPVTGSDYQSLHTDFRRPLFPEQPEIALPQYMLVVSFGLVPVTSENGPIEIVPGSHRGESSEIRPIHLEIGDVLIRHPWAMHRGTPNNSATPRPLVSIRYVRRWYCDDSREVNAIPHHVWESLTEAQRRMMRFPILSRGRRTASSSPSQ